VIWWYGAFFFVLDADDSNRGWRRLIGSPKLQVIFHKTATKYRALLRKMTYKDKGSYESSPPCSIATLFFENVWGIESIVCQLTQLTIFSKIIKFLGFVLSADTIDTIFQNCSLSAQKWKNWQIALWLPTNRSIARILVLAGSRWTITEITEYVYFSLRWALLKLRYKNE